MGRLEGNIWFGFIASEYNLLDFRAEDVEVKPTIIAVIMNKPRLFLSHICEALFIKTV